MWLLGGTSQNSLATSSIDWNTDSLYLGVTIRGTAASPVYDSEMTPRKQITAVAYAFNADEIDGIHATSTAAVANYLLSLDSLGNLDLYTGGVSSTRATTTQLYVTNDAQIGGNATTTGSLYITNALGLDTYISAWTDLNTLLSVSHWLTNASGWLTTTSSEDVYIDGNATTTGYLVVGSPTWNYVDGAGDLIVEGGLEVDGTSYFQRTTSTQATTTDYLWLGGWATPVSGFDLQGGDIYVGSDLYVARNATTTGNFTVASSTAVLANTPTLFVDAYSGSIGINTACQNNIPFTVEKS